MVVVVAQGNKKTCPVRALQRYLILRTARVSSNTSLPVFMTEFLHVAGSSAPCRQSPGFYTQSRYRKDVETAVKQLTESRPNLKPVFKWLVVHSLRSGLPTTLQDIEDLPEDVQKEIVSTTSITTIKPVQMLARPPEPKHKHVADPNASFAPAALCSLNPVRH